MRLRIRLAGCGAVLTVLVVALMHRATRAEERAAAHDFDPAHPETWDAAVQRLEKQQDALVESLIAVAQDEKRNPDERRKAILMLSRVSNARSLEFLVANVSLKLVGRVVSAEDLARLYPCAYALSQRRAWRVEAMPRGFPPAEHTDWRSGQAIVFGVRWNPRTPRELMHLALALEGNLGKGLAADAVDYAIQQHAPPDSIWRKNLTGIKTYLEHK